MIPKIEKTPSDYQVGIDLSDIHDPIWSNNSNPYAYILYDSQKYYFTGSPDPYITAPSKNLVLLMD